MAEIKILSENQIETYRSPDVKIKQQVIIYQAAGMAPRTIWIDADQLPDVAYQMKNPGQAVPANVQDQGDKVRRARIEAEIAKIGKVPGVRSI